MAAKQDSNNALASILLHNLIGNLQKQQQGGLTNNTAVKSHPTICPVSTPTAPQQDSPTPGSRPLQKQYQAPVTINTSPVVELYDKPVNEVVLPIKVFNPKKKRDSKIFMLHLRLDELSTLKHLQEQILEQIGKKHVRFDLKFDVGYLAGSQNICFHEKDDMKQKLMGLSKKGKTLWCNGLKLLPDVDSDVTICLDSSDSEDDRRPAAKKCKTNASESKAQRVDALANELREKHKDKFNKIQYKLWAEALDVKRHTSKDDPPAGPIWNTKKARKNNSVDSMATAFTDMANSVASAFTREKPTSPKPAPVTPDVREPNVSPGRKIDFQDKLLKQIDFLHKMYERGAITSEQFEKRRESLLLQ